MAAAKPTAGQDEPAKGSMTDGTGNRRVILLVSFIMGLVAVSYLLAAMITAIYISAAIDLFPGDTYTTCGKADPSETDGKTTCDWTRYPLTAGSHTEEVTFKSADGKTNLVGWWLGAQSVNNASAPRASLLYHHGSGLNIAAEYRLDRYDFFLKQGINVFTYDYPEYGKSDGVASEESINLAAKGALAWLITKTNASGTEDLLQLGRSLGGAVAIRLASDLGKEEKAFKGTIIQSAFSSYADAVASFFPTTAWAAKATVGTLFNSVSYAQNAKGCLFHYHGVSDEWVPVSQGRQLHEAATGFDAGCSPKMYEDTGVLHDEAMSKDLMKATSSWLDTLFFW